MCPGNQCWGMTSFLDTLQAASECPHVSLPKSAKFAIEKTEALNITVNVLKEDAVPSRRCKLVGKPSN